MGGMAESDANILNFPDTIKTYNHGRLNSYLKSKQAKKLVLCISARSK